MGTCNVEKLVRDNLDCMLFLHQFFEEGIEFFVQSLQKFRVEHHGIVINEVEVADGFAVLAHKYEGEGVENAHGIDFLAQLAETLLDDRCSDFVQVFFRGFQPLSNDGAVEFLHIVVVGQQFCALRLHLHVNVGEHGFCVFGELGGHLVDGALDLLDGLLRCFHCWAWLGELCLMP